MVVAGMAVQSDNGGNTGVVMGGTAPKEAAAVRQRFPTLPFLLPGIGRQGGDVDATARASFTGDPASCLIAVAGAIMYADDCRGAAISWRDHIRRACGRDGHETGAVQQGAAPDPRRGLS